MIPAVAAAIRQNVFFGIGRACTLVRLAAERIATHAPDPVVRQRMMAALAEHEALRAENVEKALRQLNPPRGLVNGYR
jgi:hypothetical protein